MESLNELQTPGERLFVVGLITCCNMEWSLTMAVALISFIHTEMKDLPQLLHAHIIHGCGSFSCFLHFQFLVFSFLLLCLPWDPHLVTLVSVIRVPSLSPQSIMSPCLFLPRHSVIPVCFCLCLTLCSHNSQRGQWRTLMTS